MKKAKQKMKLLQYKATKLRGYKAVKLAVAYTETNTNIQQLLLYNGITISFSICYR